MGLYENFPYTNVHELNLDWVINKVKTFQAEIDALNDKYENHVKDEVNEYIDEHLSQFLLGAMYDEENTSIRLQPAVVIGEGDHVYNSTEERITVLEGR